MPLPAAPLHSLLAEHFERFRGRYEVELEQQLGRWWPVVDEGS